MMLTVKPNNNLNSLADSFFNDFFSFPKEENFGFDNQYDIVDKDNIYNIVANVPGFSKDDIKIEVEDNILSISAKVEEKQEEKKEDENIKYIFKGRTSNSFKKIFKLDNSIDVENITAEVKNGVLKLEIPKKAKEEPKRIEIKTA